MRAACECRRLRLHYDKFGWKARPAPIQFLIQESNRSPSLLTCPAAGGTGELGKQKVLAYPLNEQRQGHGPASVRSGRTGTQQGGARGDHPPLLAADQTGG